jgi:hypothetical protein
VPEARARAEGERDPGDEEELRLAEELLEAAGIGSMTRMPSRVSRCRSQAE